MPPRSRVSLVDTNVLLRYLLGDDPVQSPLAAAFFAKVEAADLLVEISDAVLAETVWVLEKSFRAPRADVAEQLLPLVQFDGVRVRGGKRAVVDALTRYAETRFDIVDCLLAARARASKTRVYTFDQDFKRLACASERPR